MKKTALFLAVILLFSACSVTFTPGEIIGKGEVTEKTFDVGEFTGIRANGQFDIVWTQGDKSAVKAEIQPNLAEYLTVKVENGVLVAGSEKKFSVSTKAVKLYITSPSIETLEVNGAASFSNNSLIKGKKFALDIKGAGNVKLSGEVDTLTVDVSGAGSLSAYDLVAKDCEIALRGAGNAEINVTRTLSATIAGAGSISYKGDPEVDKKIDGIGSVKQKK